MYLRGTWTGDGVSVDSVADKTWAGLATCYNHPKYFGRKLISVYLWSKTRLHFYPVPMVSTCPLTVPYGI